MIHVEIMKVVMFSDVFPLSFKLLQETQFIIRMTQEFKVCSGRVYLFLCDISVPNGWGFFSSCKVNHNYISESIFQHVPRKQQARVFCICGTRDMQSIATKSEHSLIPYPFRRKINATIASFL